MFRATEVLAIGMISCFVANSALAETTVHIVRASSFADPADVRAYKRCLRSGRTPKQCLAVGDNGIGLWGDDTTVDKPMCALPRTVWQAKWGRGNAARGKRIEISFRGRKAVCELRDTLPAKPKHNVGIDLNPGAARALGLTPPFLQDGVGWRWVD